MLRFTFYVGQGFIANAIQLFTRSQVTHVEQCLDINTMEGYGIDVGHKLGSLPITRHKDGIRVCVVEVEATPEQVEAFFLAKDEFKGARYDYLGILGFALNKQKFNKDSRWYCSEIEAYALEKAGLNPFRKGSVSHEMVSPKMLFTSDIFQNPKWGTIKDGAVVWDKA